VLSLGSHTVYQSTATVETLVPTTYVGLCKMYIRWGRSAARESFLALRFSVQRALGLGPFRGPVMLMDAVLQPLTIALRVVGLVGGTWIMLSRPHIARWPTARSSCAASAPWPPSGGSSTPGTRSSCWPGSSPSRR
jgi:hypothetical protein